MIQPRARSPQPQDCWAKLLHEDPADRLSPVVDWLPLIDHCRDVAACFAALLGYDPHQHACHPSLLRRRLAALAGQPDLDPAQCAKLCVFAGLHDFGKANHGFQRKAHPGHGRQAGHLREALGLFTCDHEGLRTALCQALDCETLVKWCGGTEPEATALALLTACVSHHGRAVEPEEQAMQALWGATAERDPMAHLTELRQALRNAFPASDHPAAPLPDAVAFQHGLCGLVQLADWIGSDVRRFPIDRSGAQDWDWQCQRARESVRTIGLDTSHFHRRIPHAPGILQVIPDAPADSLPRPMQAAVQGLEYPEAAGITLIEDETGSGKTEAALLHFLRLFAMGAVEGMYLALPTRTAAVQIFERVNQAWKATAGADAPAPILAVPGYLRAGDAEGERLPGFQFRWDEGTGQAHDRHDADRFWAAEHSKRYLAGCVVVGTVDQVLLSALAVPHHHLRAAPLMRHLLVVDEVHASDAYMTAILRRVLARHREAGGHALLLSATLGATAAARLLDPFARTTPTPPDFAAAIAQAYPLLRGDAIHRPVASDQEPRSIAITCEPQLGEGSEPIARIAEWCRHHARAGARVLVIRNTVGACRTLFTHLSEQDPDILLSLDHPDGYRVPAPHHSRYAAEDRRRLDAAVEAALGKHAPRDRGLVVVATQTCEQSLDIDADFLITDLCPGDVLLQRLGRLHRHRGRPRPPGYDAPQALVLVPDRPLLDHLDAKGRPVDLRGTGLGTVYEDLRVLQATWTALLQDEHRPLVLPTANRNLVEACTHPEALAAYDRQDERWRLHGGDRWAINQQHRQQANLNLLPWDQAFDFSDGGYARLACIGKLEKKVSTRLGLDDRRLRLPPDTAGPFGDEIRHLTLPGYWFDRRPFPFQDEADKIERQADALLLEVGDWTFHYSAIGLELHDA